MYGIFITRLQDPIVQRVGAVVEMDSHAAPPVAVETDSQIPSVIAIGMTRTCSARSKAERAGVVLDQAATNRSIDPTSTRCNIVGRCAALSGQCTRARSLGD